MKVLPLSITQPVWTNFITLTEEVMCISPTRGLDNAKIDLNDLAAFYACLDLDNDPLTLLRKQPGLEARHVNLGFIAVISQLELLEIVSDLDSMYKSVFGVKKNHDRLLLITGNVYSWFVNIIHFCKMKNKHVYTKMFLSQVYLILANTRFRDLFINYNITRIGEVYNFDRLHE